MKKRIPAALLVLCIVLSLFPVSAAAASAQSGSETGIFATVDGNRIDLTAVDAETYLFLPASASLSALELTLPEGGTYTVTGDKDTQELSGTGGTLDLTKLVHETAGVMTLTITDGADGSLTLYVMHGSGLPTIYLTSADEEAEGRAWVDAKKGRKATVAMTMVAENGSTVCASGTTEIKARGNSTFYYAEKKSYQIKLQSKADLLGTGEKVKTWVLLANYFDATAMHDKLFKDLAAAMRMPYTASCDWVNLYYDGEYRGTYLLSEKVSVNSTGVDITDMEEAYEALNPGYGSGHTIMTGTNSYGQKIQYTARLTEPENITGGYLIELNNNEIDEYSGFTTKQGVSVNVKSPEFVGKAAMSYISEYYQAFEDAVFAADHTGYNAETGKYYYEYVDLTSLVQMFLLDELGVSPDGFLKSFYFYKDVDGLMYAGPLWDMDMTLGTAWNVAHRADVDYRRHYLAAALYEIPGFRAAVEEYYRQTFAPLVSEIFSSGGRVSRYRAALSASAEMNCKLWPLLRLGDRTQADAAWPEGTGWTDVVGSMQTWAETKILALNARYHLTKSTGDVNMDGRINTIDAVAILRYLVGYEDEIDVQAADFNQDGRLNTADAVALLRYLVGLTD